MTERYFPSGIQPDIPGSILVVPTDTGDEQVYEGVIVNIPAAAPPPAATRDSFKAFQLGAPF